MAKTETINQIYIKTTNASKTLTANAYTEIGTTTLEKGLWLVLQQSWLSDTGNDFYNSNCSSNYGNTTSIFPAYNGGTNTLVALINVEAEQTTITHNIYYSRAITGSVEVKAIKLK